MIYYKNWLFFMRISRFVYLKTKLWLVLCQKIRSIIHRIGVQSFILLSQSAQYFCLTAILHGQVIDKLTVTVVFISLSESYHNYIFIGHLLQLIRLVTVFKLCNMHLRDHLYSIQGPLGHVPIVALQCIFTSIKRQPLFKDHFFLA